MKLRGVISLRNDLPICAMPNGIFTRPVSTMALKSTNMPCAVSGPQISDGRFVAQRADVRFEHHVERARRREAAGFAGRRRRNQRNLFRLGLGKIPRLHRLQFALDRLLAFESLGLFLQVPPRSGRFPARSRIPRSCRRQPPARKKIWSARKRCLDTLQSTIGSVKPPTCPEASQTFGMHDDGGFEAHDVVAAPHHVVPPAIADVLLQFHAQRAVIPKAVDAAVNFGRLENETASFAERNDLFHQFTGLRLSHRRVSFGQYRAGVKKAQGRGAALND